jgi:competence protein ComEC
MPLLGVVAWAGGLAGTVLPPMTLVVVGVCTYLLAAGACVRWRPAALLVAALLLVTTGAASVAVLRMHQVEHNAVAELASQGAAVSVVGTVTSDPRIVSGGFGDRVVWRLEVRAVSGRGRVSELAAPVLVMADTGLAQPIGTSVRVHGRLAPADGRDLAALLLARDAEVIDGPGPWWRAAAAVRQSLRDSVAHRPADQRALVPALVVGDDAGLDPGLEDDFRTTGLTHLLAVSGTNLTLVVGFLLVVARWCRVRGRWLYVVGAVGILGFVLLARTEPSVLRAAVMGSVALIAMGSNGRQRGLRALGTAVLVLVYVDPGLAVEAGFALSVLATGGILALAPVWRDALARWLPTWVAEAVAVPSAAQLACTPVVAAISGQVSIVAVAANLLVAPVVGPATVLGLAGGLAGLLWDWLAELLGTLAAWSVAWIVVVAERGAALPTAAVDWGTSPLALAALTALVVSIALVAPALLRRPVTGLAGCLLLVLGVLVGPPQLGWPPAGWVLVACDVGQGDALVIRAAPDAAVVVDAGPEPRAVDRCLDRLGIREVPLLVLTHFHADHVDGVDGVWAGREVGAVVTTRLRDPPQGVARVEAAARAHGLSVLPASYGAAATYGGVTLQVLWPPPTTPTRGPGDGSTANEASVVLLVDVRGVRMLLCGDVEPQGQTVLARALPGLDVDVLKMPHHGSRYQDEGWLLSLRAEVVLVSVGADNDYGHPARSSLEPLQTSGAEVGRTDLDGDLAVVEEGGTARLVRRGR